MAAGLGILRIEPRVFWSMTLRELAAALRCLGSGVDERPPSRLDVDRLMQRYPDEVSG
jgi:uncharacterized phage protein (TIGR02216 family)